MKKRIFHSHRGFNSIAPENTMPAFAAALVCGADEIELDVWPTKDGELVVCHDSSVNRTTTSEGIIYEMTADEVRACDAGSKFHEEYAGLQIPFFEEVLRLLAGKVQLSIHIKSINKPPVTNEEYLRRAHILNTAYKENVPFTDAFTDAPLPTIQELENVQYQPYDEKLFQKILRLIDKYHCRDTVYITGEKDVLETALKLAPDIERCCLEGHMNFTIVENAIQYKCNRVQFTKLFTTQAMIDKAHENGITCNMFWADNKKEADLFFEKGIDVVVTNHLLRTAK